MGAFSFYIQVKLPPDTAGMLLGEYRAAGLYQTAFGLRTGELGGGFNMEIEAKLDNFLPACTLIYRLLAGAKQAFFIRVNRNERLFDFEDKADFISYMYRALEGAIDRLYGNFGTLVLDNGRYDRQRNRLYRRYYRKF